MRQKSSGSAVLQSTDHPARKSTRPLQLRAARDNSQCLPIVRNLLKWFDKNARDLPWRHTADPYAIWLSEIMLQQTQVKTVIPYWLRWMQALPDIQSLAKARPEKLLKLWEGLGYYTRVHNAQKAARLIMQKHGGEFPRAFDQVLELPGVGRYTVGAICSIAFNQPTPVLDGNVSRVLCRVFGIGGDPKSTGVRQKLWALAETLVVCANKQRCSPKHLPGSQGACSAFNQAMMELGALVCAPATPNCAVCPLQSVCAARGSKGRNYGRARSRQKQTKRTLTAFIVRKGNKFLVRRRPTGVVNAMLWEFPSVEGGSANLKDFAPFRPLTRKRLCRIQHTITRYCITVEVFEAALIFDYNRGLGVFKSLGELHNLPFTAAHKRILSHLTAP